MSNLSFNEVIKRRRSIYSLNHNVALSKKEINELVNFAMKHSPSAFHSQTSRAIILYDHHHLQLWDIVEDTLRSIVPPENFSSTISKLDSFRKGIGTILFFEDDDVIKSFEKSYPSYAENFSGWAEQSTGIAQFALWCSLTHENMGASLQHYNPIIDSKVKEEWNIPTNWILKAQMPFGGVESRPNEKDFIPDELRIKVFTK